MTQTASQMLRNDGSLWFAEVRGLELRGESLGCFRDLGCGALGVSGSGIERSGFGPWQRNTRAGGGSASLELMLNFKISTGVALHVDSTGLARPR